MCSFWRYINVCNAVFWGNLLMSSFGSLCMHSGTSDRRAINKQSFEMLHPQHPREPKGEVWLLMDVPPSKWKGTKGWSTTIERRSMTVTRCFTHFVQRSQRAKHNSFKKPHSQEPRQGADCVSQKSVSPKGAKWWGTGVARRPTPQGHEGGSGASIGPKGVTEPWPG